MKKFIVLVLVAVCSTAVAQKKIPHAVKTYNEITGRRTEIVLPKVKGYNCYKGDFHIHTTYSDGRVNPAGRVVEAWVDGLDVIAITDHYESRTGERNFLKVIAPYFESTEPLKYQSASKAKRVLADFNAIHQEAENQVAKSGYPILVIKGCEMARNAQTHGHFNALFLQDINGLYDADLEVAFQRVKEQGGIVIHNHPAWKRDTSDKTEFHEKVYSQGLISGVEVANGYTFYPHIVRRCIDEGLTMFANSDEHSLATHRFQHNGNLRTMTIIFAKELTEKAIKDAILKRRTIAYSGGFLIGEESWLVEFLNAAVDCRLAAVKEKNEHIYTLTNQSSITLRLRRGKSIYELEPFKSVLVSFGKGKEGVEATKPLFSVDNMWVADYKHPKVNIEIDK
ncbi:MAG: hypothetical protein IJZ67_00550 [Alistipes sp.]|nr:hypothetical protein [Alistipes sp.]